mmetsp:Transcript_12784/g.37122  ORF Transcript_12784/g.37122 Transcript_12784/m.37122 type:complete len:315 (+) Transcript_12784:3138-4082(+)
MVFLDSEQHRHGDNSGRKVKQLLDRQPPLLWECQSAEIEERGVVHPSTELLQKDSRQPAGLARSEARQKVRTHQHRVVDAGRHCDDRPVLVGVGGVPISMLKERRYVPADPHSDHHRGKQDSHLGVWREGGGPQEDKHVEGGVEARLDDADTRHTCVGKGHHQRVSHHLPEVMQLIRVLVATVILPPREADDASRHHQSEDTQIKGRQYIARRVHSAPSGQAGHDSVQAVAGCHVHVCLHQQRWRVRSVEVFGGHPGFEHVIENHDGHPRQQTPDEQQPEVVQQHQQTAGRVEYAEQDARGPPTEVVSQWRDDE